MIQMFKKNESVYWKTKVKQQRQNGPLMKEIYHKITVNVNYGIH